MSTRNPLIPANVQLPTAQPRKRHELNGTKKHHFSVRI